MADLWRACTAKDPSARPTAAQVEAKVAGLLQASRLTPADAPAKLSAATRSSCPALQPAVQDTAYAPGVRGSGGLLDTVWQSVLSSLQYILYKKCFTLNKVHGCVFDECLKMHARPGAASLICFACIVQCTLESTSPFEQLCQQQNHQCMQDCLY